MLNWISKSIGLPLEENLHADAVEDSPSARDPGGGTLSDTSLAIEGSERGVAFLNCKIWKELL